MACILPFAAGCSNSAQHLPLQPTGSLEGSISFVGALPKPEAINIKQHPACAKLQHFRPWYRRYWNEDQMRPRTLPPVFLWISSGISNPGFKQPPQETVLTQFNCHFHPQLLGVMPNQFVDFTNGDPIPAHFRISPRTTGNPALNLTLRPHHPGATHSFPHPELLIPVTSPGRPWMHAYLNIVPTPYFTISGSQGHFRLPDLPSGTYTLSAIRPGVPVQTQSVTIKPHSTTHTSFTFAATPPSPSHK